MQKLILIYGEIYFLLLISVHGEVYSKFGDENDSIFKSSIRGQVV